MVKRELKIMMEADHPNIMKVHEALEDEFKIYFVIDDIKG